MLSPKTLTRRLRFGPSMTSFAFSTRLGELNHYAVPAAPSSDIAELHATQQDCLVKLFASLLMVAATVEVGDF